MIRKLKTVLILLMVLVLATACGKNTGDEPATDTSHVQEEAFSSHTGIPYAEKTFRVEKYIPLNLMSEARTDPANLINHL